jgi:hypothetical protein
LQYGFALRGNIAILGEKRPSGQAGTHSPRLVPPSYEDTSGIFPIRTNFLFRNDGITDTIRVME